MSHNESRARAVLILLGVLAFAVSPWDASAQCCTAGNPASTNCNVAGDGAHRLNVAYTYMYSSSDTYYSGTRRLDKTYSEIGYDYSALSLSYGVSEKLRVTADIGYYFDKAQRFVNSDYTRYAQGISDGTLGIGYNAYSSEDNLFRVDQTARLTIPIGNFDQEYDGVVLPIDFQPSSGNYRYAIGLILTKRFEGSDFSLMSINSVEFSQAIETRNTYHKYGNLYLASLMGSYRISPYLQGLLQLRYEMRDRALNGTIGGTSGAGTQYSFLNSSGGVIAYVSPQIAVNVFNAWMFSVQYNLPVYKNIYGDEQLTNRHSVAINLSRAFDFGGVDLVDEPTGHGEGEHTAELSVGGNCEMCKDRIEAVALSTAHVLTASWDAEKETLTLTYDDPSLDLDDIAKAIAKAGHDTAGHAAPDDVYAGLPACCHYRD